MTDLKIPLYEVIAPKVHLLKDIIEYCRYRQRTDWAMDIDGESARKFLADINCGEKTIETILPAILDHETPIKYTEVERKYERN
jgi:hypothetical protein